jgi:hypothetical protein
MIKYLSCFEDLTNVRPKAVSCMANGTGTSIIILYGCSSHTVKNILSQSTGVPFTMYIF